MFKKLKDKLAEEVKSSPQRIQQFAQAAQAAVTSASSSISDITNNDLFSIGESDSQQSRPHKQADLQQRDVLNTSSASNASLQPGLDLVDIQPAYLTDTPRQRRLSNSSLASDVSFKLPSYESPSMYHLQSDMDVSASEAEERALASPGAGGAGGVSLERVSKEQLYGAYRRTQQRYNKYRTQYADLARHYKILERENAKARSVLVETQDKALRRISELREQCSLEQSAKAHLERALRIEIEERNIKIETLTTKIDLLQSNANITNSQENVNMEIAHENQQQLIDITVDENSQKADEFSTLKIKVEKLEQLVTKYKESLKTIKEKNTQLTTEVQVLSNELENKVKENEQLKTSLPQLSEANDSIQQLKNINEDLQNKLNTYDFTKTKELTMLESDLQKEREEMAQLKRKIEIFSKKEEEYAISLAENKLTIHKELDSKEAEIKSLKEILSASNKEIQSINIITNDYKQRVSALEEECSKLNTKINELTKNNEILSEKDTEVQEITQKIYKLEQLVAKTNEEYKCLQLQLKQETAEKLAMVDRNTYLEDRIKQLNEDNSKKTTKLSEIDRELQKYKEEINHRSQELSELHIWKEKYETLEHEIGEERVELVKLQAEIEKLLKNDDFVQAENSKLHTQVLELKALNEKQQKDLMHFKRVQQYLFDIKQNISEFRKTLLEINRFMQTSKENNEQLISEFGKEFNDLLNNFHHNDQVKLMEDSLNNLKIQYDNVCQSINKLNVEKEQLIEQNKSNHNFKEVINEIKNEKEILIAQLKEMELKHTDAVSKSNDMNNEINKLNTKCSTLIDNNAKIQSVNEIIKEELEKSSEECKAYSEKIYQLEKENKDLILKLKDSDKIANKMKVLLDENDELKSKFESIVNNVCELEKELTQVKNSHLEIDREKDHLTLVLKELEQNMQNKLNTLNVETQTNETFDTIQHSIDSNQEENNILRSRCEQIKQEKETLHEKVILLDQKCIELQTEIDKIIDDSKTQNTFFSAKDKQLDLLQQEVTSLKEENLRLTTAISEHKIEKREMDAQQSSSNNITIDEHAKFETLKSDYDLLKEDNRRLQSDIEGLQTYLTKISKENSILNDKLREVIATSEPDTNDLLENINKLNSNILVEKVKVEELFRQNALIAEENLELRDQLQSHTYENNVHTKKTEDKDNSMHSKYEQLLKSKSELDTQFKDLEIQNKTTHNNMIHMQESNQKLRLSNEKLERRLDEALVSLRHLHALQENTELEYLKNILYEYLTGSGTHSVTLAKVLAAVVKFDDKQTNAVLQKEKERQGLLRQLGLL